MNRIKFNPLDSNKLAEIAKSHNRKNRNFLKFVSKTEGVLCRKCIVAMFCLDFWKKIIN